MAGDRCRIPERVKAWEFEPSTLLHAPLVYWLGRQSFKLQKGDRNPRGVPSRLSSTGERRFLRSEVAGSAPAGGTKPLAVWKPHA